MVVVGSNKDMAGEEDKEVEKAERAAVAAPRSEESNKEWQGPNKKEMLWEELNWQWLPLYSATAPWA